MRITCCLIAALFAVAAEAFSQGTPALVMENIGLKNTYRVVFNEFDEIHDFTHGAIEILGDGDGRTVPHTRIPFAAKIGQAQRDKETEELEIWCTALMFFFPPAQEDDPLPTVNWTLIGRRSENPTLKVKLWAFGKDAWALEEFDLEKANDGPDREPFQGGR